MADASEIAWLGAVKGFTFVGSTALALYALLARGAAAPASASVSPAPAPVDSRLPLALTAAGVLAAVVLLVAIHRSEERVEEEIDRQLTAMADSKSLPHRSSSSSPPGCIFRPPFPPP